MRLVFPQYLFSLTLLTLNLLSYTSAYSSLSDDTLRVLPDPGTDFDIHNGALLAPILRPRVPGTPGSKAVLEHFVTFFRNTLPEWQLEFQNSTSKTPVTGSADVPFVNLIAKRDPPWALEGEVGRLTLVAHYDSKLEPAGFIGATDSAAPCAMIMHAARSVDEALTKKWAAMQAEGAGEDAGLGDEEKGVQILLLDGEEAFKDWSDDDSLYGARSLAEEWDQTLHPALSTYRTPLSSITLFVLLDLLGAANPVIPSYSRTTHWAYQHLSKLESRLRSLSLLKSSPNHPSKRNPQHKRENEPTFLPEGNKYENSGGHSGFVSFGVIEDDHIPFMARGVEILHVIPARFPTVWHKIEDDGEHLDLDTVHDWAMLVTAFVAEWMDLEGFFATTPVENKPEDFPAEQQGEPPPATRPTINHGGPEIPQKRDMGQASKTEL
ncbi:MAG: hypothetical protein M1823_000123 [Watsoniomyces obsoletus]|nr:MAG: hypothetical protein M1823_000123 [Watsoniomyces obsoletus]